MQRKKKGQGSRQKHDSKRSRSDARLELFRDFVRKEGSKYLDDPNINSVGVGYKIKNGGATNQLSIQFTVDKKLDHPELESVGSALIPETVHWKGADLPTDVIQRTYHPSYRLVK